MTLYVRYSIRDMSCDHLLGETNVDTGRRMLNEDEITAFDHAPVGWWTDNLWINGQNVDMPGLSGGETWAGDENGEIVVSECTGWIRSACSCRAMCRLICRLAKSSIMTTKCGSRC